MKIFSTVNISKLCIAKNFIWATLKAISIFFLHPQIPDFLIVVSQLNIVLSLQTIHQWNASLFSFKMKYKSQFKKIDT